MSLERSVPGYQRLDTALFIYVLNLYCSQSGGKSTYQGKTVTALVGSSVNFTWNFSGDVGRVQWGLKMVDMYDIDYNNSLVVLVVGTSSPVLSPLSIRWTCDAPIFVQPKSEKLLEQAESPTETLATQAMRLSSQLFASVSTPNIAELVLFVFFCQQPWFLRRSEHILPGKTLAFSC